MSSPVASAVPAITFPESLPVSARREEIAQAMRDHQVVIVCGETGSGKTTQLPKIALELGRGWGAGGKGLIGHTQPRRIAASSVAKRIAEELKSPLGEVVFNGGAMRRDFTYITDIVAGVLAALDRPPADDGQLKPGGFTTPHALYNLGNDTPVELADFIATIARACGRDAILDPQPMQPGDVTATWADISAARRDLGFAPATPLATGIPAFVDWFRGFAR